MGILPRRRQVRTHAGLFLFKRRDAGLARLEIEHMGDRDHSKMRQLKSCGMNCGTVTNGRESEQNSSGVARRHSQIPLDESGPALPSWPHYSVAVYRAARRRLCIEAPDELAHRKSYHARGQKWPSAATPNTVTSAGETFANETVSEANRPRIAPAFSNDVARKKIQQKGHVVGVNTRENSGSRSGEGFGLPRAVRSRDARPERPVQRAQATKSNWGPLPTSRQTIVSVRLM